MRVFVALILVLSAVIAFAQALGTESGQVRALLLRSETPASKQIAAVQAMVGRLLGLEIQQKFTFIIDDSAEGDIFTISTPNVNQVRVKANSGVSLASGVYWYLKYNCKCDISWGVNGTGDQLSVPNPLPYMAQPLTMKSPVKYRYYMNVCTVSYSSVWWDWERWEREIDWMAMNGYNLPLSFTGQEYVWTQVWRDLGMTQADLDEWFSGPAFLAWNRMGNIQGWAGPLDEAWQKAQYEMQLKILQRQRDFGMIPVLPAFAGHVPPAFKRLYPHVNLTVSHWGAGFPGQYGDVEFLEPAGGADLFVKIGGLYIKKQTALLGTEHIYQCDTWNEMLPPSNNSDYLKSTSQVVYQSLLAGDPDAVWLMQGWTFINGKHFWHEQEVEAYLSGVPDDGLIILDLYAETEPGFSRFSNWYGKYFVWCMLHNFGGRRSIYGNLNHIATAPLAAIQTAPNMIGMGITMEAIEQNPIIYNLMSEMGWHETPVDAYQWTLNYATRRYGRFSQNAQLAWTELYNGVYGPQGTSEAVFQHLPLPSLTTNTNPNATAIINAWNYLMTAVDSNELQMSGPLSYDLVDVARQALANLFYDYLQILRYEFSSWASKPSKQYDNISKLIPSFVHILKDLDNLLATDPNYLLGVWLQNAASHATTPALKKLYMFNAKNQLTLWGPNGNINDYAAKHWAGLVGDYYFQRWNYFLNELVKAMINKSWNQNAYVKQALTLSQRWNAAGTMYPARPEGNVLSTSQRLFEKYANMTLSSKFDAHPNTDAPGGDMFQAYSRTLSQLMMLCDADVSCVGFNSNGWIKATMSSTVSMPGVTFYSKK